MATDLRVPMPGSDADLRSYMDARVKGGDLDPALDRSVVEFDELAQLAGVAVTAVEASSSAVAVHYVVAWTSFHACDDRRFGGEHARVLRGRVDGRDWVFARFQCWPAQRDCVDEF